MIRQWRWVAQGTGTGYRVIHPSERDAPQPGQVSPFQEPTNLVLVGDPSLMAVRVFLQR